MEMKTSAKLAAAAMAAILLAGAHPSAAQEKKYLGNLACKDKCHEEIYKAWKSTKHAASFNNLNPGDREKGKKEAGLKPKTDYRTDKSCMPCHVTGWMDGGYSFETQNQDLLGVGCESCHGPAEKWNAEHQKKDLENRERRMKQMGQRKPFGGKNVCAQCHEDESSPYKFRSPPGAKDWTDKKMTSSYHPVK